MGLLPIGFRSLAACAVLCASLVCGPASAGPRPPATPRRPVEDDYHGLRVTEDYRWLEDSANLEVQSWSDSQNTVTRAFLDSFPKRSAILRPVEELTRSLSPLHYALDVDFFTPSLDGSKVAVSLSKSGTESGTVYVFDAATGVRLPDEVPRVNGGTAGGSVAWNAEGTGFWRTRYPAEGERPEEDLPFYQQVYFHRLGTPESSDTYAIGKEFPKIAEIALSGTGDGRWLLVNVSNGDGGDHAFWLAGPHGSFRQIARFEDRAVAAEFGDDALYLLSRRDAPNGKVLRLALVDALAGDDALERARLLVPEGKTAVESFTPTRSRLYVRDMAGGPSEVRVFDAPEGTLRGKLPIPRISSVGDMVKTAGDDLLVEVQSYTEPPRWWRLDATSGKLEPTPLRLRSPADYSDTEVRREFAVSKDGTRVPINILFRKGTRLDGGAPCLLTGYGGYGISLTPGFSPSRRLWIEQGGILAVANIRGGGEYGDAWHRAGNLIHKQNVFDDFAACARFLVDRKYTSRERLAIQGGSNGGLLMGAMITQHPELCRAVVSSVGVYDMLRVERTSNGEFNVTEYGTVKDPEQLRALLAYSPYHNVRDGTRFPAILMPTGANDPRVEPWHSRKMVARLQAASTSGEPILLRTSATTGHGGGTPRSLRNQQLADMYVFPFKVMQIHYRAVTTGLP